MICLFKLWATRARIASGAAFVVVNGVPDVLENQMGGDGTWQ